MTKTPSKRTPGHVVVIGGGILGMALAKELQSEGFTVEILERSDRTGGLAAPEEIGDFTWDRFYHVILLSDIHLRDLLDEIGLSNRTQWSTTKTGFFTDGKLYSMSNSVEFLKFPPLNLVDKFRLGWTIFFASRVKNWKKLELVNASVWLTRLSGQRVFDRIWLPLLRSKLGENYEKASAAFIWAIIQRMYAARRSGLKREMFGYVAGGYKTVLDRLQDHLDGAGVITHCGESVSIVENRNGRIRVGLRDGSYRNFDSAVLTVPTSVAAKLCPQLPKEVVSRYESVTYQGIICASVLLKKPLSEYYVTNITDQTVPFTGVIEMTALVDPRHFNDHSLVYLPRYLPQRDERWEMADAEIREEFVDALDRMYPHFTPSDVLDFRISRARQVLAISTLGYSDRLLPPVGTSIPGIYVINSAQIANGTLNVNETLGVVKAKLPELISLMTSRFEAGM